MISLSSVAIREKNLLAANSCFLVCIELVIPGLEQVVRIVGDSQNLTWQGETWVAFPFTLGEINTSAGEVPRVELNVSNVNRIMDTYVKYYDEYIKANGYSPVVMNIYVVNTEVIALDGDAGPEVSHTFELKRPKLNSKWASFTFGGTNPFTRRFPQNRMLRNHCRFRFKGTRCGYSGALTTCDHTLAQCRARVNSLRYGGTPGIGSSGFEIDQ